MANFNLNYEGFEANLIKREDRTRMAGVQYLFKFENNYGASVIKHEGSYGFARDLWELAVIKFGASGYWDLCYDTEITCDVEGYLTDEDVRNLLARIKGL